MNGVSSYHKMDTSFTRSMNEFASIAVQLMNASVHQMPRLAIAVQLIGVETIIYGIGIPFGLIFK